MYQDNSGGAANLQLFEKKRWEMVSWGKRDRESDGGPSYLVWDSTCSYLIGLVVLTLSLSAFSP